MKPRQFFELVTKMRVAQKNYCRTKNQMWLYQSRSLEGTVDTEIKRVIEIMRLKQQELFTDEGVTA